MYMTQGLHRTLQRRPRDEALRYLGHGLSYSELADRVARLAGGLRALGVQTGERVAMLSLNSQRYIEYFMAVPWAGAVLNPVNYRWSQAEIRYSLDDSETSVLIVDETFKNIGARLAGEAKTLRQVIYAGDGELPPGMLSYEALIAGSEPVEDAYRHGNDLAGIFYTGGTTGFPKGVMLSHNNLCSSAVGTLNAGALGADSRFLHVMPMFHLADFAVTNSQFATGGMHVVVPGYDPQGMLEAISAERVTDVLLAPTLIQMALEWMERNPERAAQLDLSSLRNLIYGAAPMSQTLLARARAAFPSARFYQGYGMTELAPSVTLLMPEFHSDAGIASGKMRSIGTAVSMVEVKIVDVHGVEVSRGTVGEIAVRGPNVMLGYWNRPEATAQAIRNGWMHTGDGGYMDDEGFVYLVDRLKDMIVSGGENVYSAEVENAVVSHPAVAQCAVIGVPHEKWGETVHAVVVTKPGHSVTLEEIQIHCRELIAGYKCPRSVSFVDAMPLSGVGKVLKTELRKPYWEK
jgi:acyl-CoA synthetase (AMP-forming)/AMP-acid ligase II